jgi:hypothetical protein
MLIFDMITATLKKLETIDYILLVTKHSDNRLTTTAEYIYQNIQNMFATDVKDRFLSMFTFSDGKKPLAIDAIK